MNLHELRNPTLEELQMYIIEGNAAQALNFLEGYYKNNCSGGEINSENAPYIKLLAIALKEQGDFQRSETITLDILKYFEKVKLTESCADCYLNLAVINRHFGNYNDSFQYLDYASSIFQELKLTEKIAKCEQSLSLLYYLLGFYREALKIVENAKRLYERARSEGEMTRVKQLYCELGAISCKHLTGLICLERKKYDEAFSYLEESRMDAEASLNSKKRMLGYIFQDLAVYYLYSDNIDKVKAKKYLNLSDEIRNEIFDKRGIAICKLYLGIIEYKNAVWEKAISYYTEAANISEQIDALDIRMKASEGLFKTHNKTGNEKAAILEVKKYLRLKKTDAENRKNDRIHLDQLLTLDAKLRELNAELEFEREANKATAEALALLIPPAAISINRKKIDKDSEKIFHENRMALSKGNSYEQANAVTKIMKTVKKVLSTEEDKTYVFWKSEYEYLLKPFYNLLLDRKCISEMSFEKFREVICNGKNNPEENFINWTSTHIKMAFLLYHLESNGILTNNYSGDKYNFILNKFKNKNKKISKAIRTEISNVGSFMRNDKAEESYKVFNESMKSIMDELLKHKLNS